jgi:hypothetical protein
LYALPSALPTCAQIPPGCTPQCAVGQWISDQWWKALPRRSRGQTQATRGVNDRPHKGNWRATTEKSARSTERHAPHALPPEDVRFDTTPPTSFDSPWRDLVCPSWQHRGRFWPSWRSWCPQRPSAAQPPRPNFLKGAPAGHGWRPPRAGRPPLSRRPPLGRPSREAGASREAISTCAPPALSIAGRGESRLAKPQHYVGKLERIVFSDATAAIFVKKKIKGTRSTKSGMQSRGAREARTGSRFGESLST